MDLQIYARIEALITEREAMKAENKEREIKGESLAYNFDHFMDISNQLNGLGR